MGGCISVYKDPDTSTKIRRTEKTLIQSQSQPPTKLKPIVNGDPPTTTGFNFQPYQSDSGSKEETFFDSQAWLDSDCEDDFLSVNGDFTPSRGNTPVHPSLSLGTPRRSFLNDRTPVVIPESSLTDKKTKLFELLEENLEGNLPQKAANVTTRVSGANTVNSIERTPSGHFKSEKAKSFRTAQCCIPSLLSSRSFNEKRKKNPVHSFR